MKLCLRNERIDGAKVQPLAEGVVLDRLNCRGSDLADVRKHDHPRLERVWDTVHEPEPKRDDIRGGARAYVIRALSTDSSSDHEES